VRRETRDLDLGHIGALGWSLGGQTVVQLCANEPRCKAVVSLDGGGGPANVPPLAQELLYVGGDLSADSVTPTFWPKYVTLFNQLTNNAYLFRIQNAVHTEFADFPWIFDVIANTHPPTPEELHMAALLRTYILSFFDEYLKGLHNHVLDGPLPEYPEIMYYHKK